MVSACVPARVQVRYDRSGHTIVRNVDAVIGEPPVIRQHSRGIEAKLNRIAAGRLRLARYPRYATPAGWYGGCGKTNITGGRRAGSGQRWPLKKED